MTFVQVKDAVELYPLFAFLAVRFAIATLTLGVPARAAGADARSRRGCGRRAARPPARGRLRPPDRGARAHDGFEHRLHHRDVRGSDAADRARALASRITGAAWGGVALSTVGLALLSGIHGGSPAGDLLVLAGAAVYSLQIVLMERFAPRYDAIAFTFVEMLAACVGLGIVAIGRGDLGLPHGWTVWGALLVTGIFASALAFLVQTWAQRNTSATRTALAFAMEPVFAALFGYTLAGDRLGAWGGEDASRSWPASCSPSPRPRAALRRLVGRSR